MREACGEACFLVLATAATVVGNGFGKGESMRISIGMKIGGGFGILLALICILGFMMQTALDDSLQTSGLIANDRVPRYAVNNTLQSNLLLAGYSVRIFFSEGKEDSLGRYRDYIRQGQASLEELTKLNRAFPVPKTTEFLDEYGRLFAQFQDCVERGVVNMREFEKTRQQMVQSSTFARQKLMTLSSNMSQTLTGYINSFMPQESRQYAANMARVSSVMEGAASALQSLLLALDGRDVKALDKTVADFKSVVAEMGQIRQYLLREDCRAMFDDASAALTTFSEMAQKISGMLRRSEELTQERIKLYNDCFSTIKTFGELVKADSTRLLQHGVTELTSSEERGWMLVGIALIIGLAFAFCITRAIVVPLRRTQEFAHEVAEGHLDRELKVTSDDETGMLADSLRVMVSSLKNNIQAAEEKSREAEAKGREATEAMKAAQEAQRMAESARRDGMLAAAGQLEGVVEVVSSASVQLSAQIEQSDKGAQFSADRLSEAATAMNQMNAAVQEVARNAAQASTVSSEMRSRAEHGADIVQHSLASIRQVHEVSSTLKQDMVQLNDHAQSISDIMSVISDIADQTNLLALNAAIEAARAGEAGRGFAVVADEVRKLAEKTMASTQDVGNAIRAIQESTAKSMESMDRAVEQVEQATGFANQSGEALQQIVNDAEVTADEVRAIATAAEEQSAASDEINKSIIHIHENVAQNAQAMNQAAQAVNALAEQTQGLSRLIEDMKRG